jgi:hypothetical protein
VVRWRRVDLRALIEARFAVRLHERCSVGKVLRRLGFARLSVRPRHPKADEAAQEAQEAFKKASPSWYARRFPSAPAASRSRSGSKMVGRGAFNRVGQQGTLTRVWARRGAARRGTRPRAPRDRRYAWAYLFGAVCPERAVGAGLVLPYANTEATGLHLAEIGHHVTPGAHAVVVLDGAGWLAHGRRPRRPREPHPPAAAALQPRAEPGRERLGVPAPEQARPAGLARLRRDRRDLLRGLELARGGARPPRLDHPPRVGQSGQQLGPLV